MATAKQIQEYLLEYGEGWFRYGTSVEKNELPKCVQANIYNLYGFFTRSETDNDDSLLFSMAQNQLDELTLSQAIQLINEKTGDNIPLPKEQNIINFSEETIKKLKDFGFEKRKYKSTKGDVYIFENQYCKIKCYPKRFFILFDSEASKLAYEASTKIEEEIPFPPNLGLIKTIYKEVFGQELQPKPKQKDYSFSAICHRLSDSAQRTYSIDINGTIASDINHGVDIFKVDSPTKILAQRKQIFGQLELIQWAILQEVNKEVNIPVTLLYDGSIRQSSQEICIKEWQDYYLSFKNKEQAQAFASSEENMSLYRGFLESARV